jgi:hypothetical protein
MQELSVICLNLGTIWLLLLLLLLLGCQGSHEYI